MATRSTAVLVSCAALVLAGCADDGNEAASVPRPSPTESAALSDPTAWPQQVSGAQLVHGVVGEQGQSRLVSSFAVGDTNLEWADICDLPGVSPHAANGPLITASVNGHLLNGTGCVPGDSTFSGPDMALGRNPREVRQGWARLGVKPGETMTVRVWLESASGERISRPQGRLGFALYKRTSPR